MILTAPAKVNLYLRVISRREDGYHEIETLFERVSLFDRVSIEPAEDRTIISCDDEKVPTDGDSLMARTVDAFRDRTGEKGHFRIGLEKNIPVSAGLGGGSSDAAALLKGLNELTGSPLEDNSLRDIGAVLGADIPFFLSDCSFALGTGRGDVISVVDTETSIRHIIVTPPFGVSTKDIYDKASAFDLTEERGVDRIITAFLKENDAKNIAENLRNDLQQIVLRDFPVLEEVISELREAGAQGVLLSGSGPTVFGIFGRTEAIQAEKLIRQAFRAEEGWRIFAAKTC